MKQKDGTYVPDGIKKGTLGCNSCMDGEKPTVRIYLVDTSAPHERSVDLCFECLHAAIEAHKNFHPNDDGWPV